MFLRVASRLAEKLNILVLATGDSLAQVSSQTVESLAVILKVSSRIVFQPLLAWNKEEIIQVARQISTYSLSLVNYLDCCALFEPSHPITKPRPEIAQKLEEEILWSEILEHIFQKIATD